MPAISGTAFAPPVKLPLAVTVGALRFSDERKVKPFLKPFGGQSQQTNLFDEITLRRGQPKGLLANQLLFKDVVEVIT